MRHRPAGATATASRGGALAWCGVLALCGTLVGCGGDDATPDTMASILPTTSTTTSTTVAPTTVPATTTTSTTSTTSTTTSTSTTSTTVAPAARLVLRDNGLGDAVFGAEPEEVVAYVRSVLGAPTADSGWADPFESFGVCPGTEVRGVTWGDLTLMFSDDTVVMSGRRHFFNYVYGPPFGSAIQPAGMRTDLGIGVGSTVADLRAAYPDVVVNPEDFFGPNFAIHDGFGGFLTGTDDTDTILSFIGGFGCGE